MFDERISPRKQKIIEFYAYAKSVVIERGFLNEIAWQDQVDFSNLTETDLLREVAWVVLSSGMREAVIRKKFPTISEAFYCWSDAGRIARNSTRCRQQALKAFGHRPKIGAIIEVARRIDSDGFVFFKSKIELSKIEFIRSLPFMGPATSYHLAKNIGLDVVKPDRHLVRFASSAGYGDPLRLCEEIAESVGDRLSVVDIVLWRFATLDRNYAAYVS
jgi:hypothetical protein